MGKSFANIWSDIVSDWSKYVEHGEVFGGNFAIIKNAILASHHCAAFSFWLRLYDYQNKIIHIICQIMYSRLSKKYGLQIFPGTNIGPGLYIGHGIGIVINRNTRIGRNCNLNHFITIGSNKNTPAIIGDDVYIGPGVCIVENVKIGNNVKIGAGTVVINDIPDNATSVGNPNRIIIK